MREIIELLKREIFAFIFIFITEILANYMIISAFIDGAINIYEAIIMVSLMLSLILWIIAEAK